MAPKASASNATRIEKPSTPERQRFALSGRSAALDPRHDAARRDIADIALAGRLFTPHYAVPERRACGWRAVDMLAAPAADARRISQLLPGEAFHIVETSGGWAWGFSGHDHYVGYVAAARLGPAAAATHVVTVPGAPLLAAPDLASPVRTGLALGSRIRGRREGEFVATDAGFVHRRHLVEDQRIGDDPVAIAERLIGQPYLWGARGAGGIDCSGLVQIAFGLAGHALPRDSDQQALAGTAATGELARGDLLCWPDHVAIAAGGEAVIHACGRHMAVIVEPLETLVARLGPPAARRRLA